MHYKHLKVDLKTPLKDQLKELGIESYIFDLDKITNLTEPQEDIYDVEDGEEMLGENPNECVEIFKNSGRRGLTIIEALALIRQNPDILKKHFIDIPGSRTAHGGVPYLWRWGGELKLHADRPDDADPSYGAVSAGVSPLPLDSLNLEDRVKSLEEFREKVEKIIKV